MASDDAIKATTLSSASWFAAAC